MGRASSIARAALAGATLVLGPGPAHDLVAHYATAFLLAELTRTREVRSLLPANDQPTTPQLTNRAEGY